MKIFTESVDLVSKSRCLDVVTLCHRGKPTSRWTGDFWSKSILLIYILCFCCFNDFCVMIFCFVFGVFAHQLMCIMGELVGEGSAAVAVAISDR